MSFSDVYLFKMDKAMQSMHLYEWSVVVKAGMIFLTQINFIFRSTIFYCYSDNLCIHIDKFIKLTIQNKMVTLINLFNSKYQIRISLPLNEALQKPQKRRKIIQVHATQTNRPNDPRQRQHVPRRWTTLRLRSQRMACSQCHRILQWNINFVRHPDRILHQRHLPNHERRPKIRVPLGRRTKCQDTAQSPSARVHWTAHDLGRKPVQQWDPFSLSIRYILSYKRCSIPQKLSFYDQNDIQTAFQGLCAYLPHPLSGHTGLGTRVSLEHLF